ncbi:hypothetical protein C0992_012418 [Termitomyces sp. T32_za158]|nr:hypothetical protein C0992_012418 [Termitomyces sp. T32_za158]
MIPKPNSAEAQAVVHDADERYLDKDEGTSHQSAIQLKKFKRKVMAQFPEIGEFEDNWPLFVILYANRRLEKQKQQRIERKKRRGRMSYNSNWRMVKKSRAAVAIQRRVYIGKPLPRRTFSRTVNPVPASSTNNSNDGVISRRVEDNATVTESSPETILISSQSQLAPRFHDVQTTTREESQDSSGMAVANHCPSQIPANSHVGSDNARIIAVCQNMQLLINALTMLGITNDKHLLILNKLATRRAGVAEFFGSLPNNKLPYLYKMTILNNLKNEQPNAVRST